MKSPQIIILLGKSGSGKGTQADFLRKKFKNYEYIESGRLLRNKAKDKDYMGKKIAQIMLEGALIPAPVISTLWLAEAARIKEKSKNMKGLIMDGNPRRLIEAQMIDEAFKFFDWDKNVKVILVDISDKEAVWRLTKRRMCKECRELIPYVGEFKKMRKCPKCGGELIRRSDDTVSSAKNRLKWFHTDVQPIVNYYKRTGRLVKVDGEKSIEDVFKDVLKVLK
ncbi:MAG: nucleoside monophosphate kinase [Candidatus Paceibacterota bacterium]|jgi:adenylate kinase